MTVTIPDYVTAEGRIKVAFVPAVTTTAPTLTELNAGVDVTCYLPENWGGVTGEQSKGEQRRMCSREVFETLGRVKRTAADFTATYLPQAAGSADGNKAKTAMAAGTQGFLVIRYGIDAIEPWTAGDKVDILPVTTGVQNKSTAASDEFAPLTYTQSVAARGPLVEDKTVVA